MMGRGTVNTDYASQAVSRALGPRDVGRQYDSANRYFRY